MIHKILTFSTQDYKQLKYYNEQKNLGTTCKKNKLKSKRQIVLRIISKLEFNRAKQSQEVKLINQKRLFLCIVDSELKHQIHHIKFFNKLLTKDPVCHAHMSPQCRAQHRQLQPIQADSGPQSLCFVS